MKTKHKTEKIEDAPLEIICGKNMSNKETPPDVIDIDIELVEATEESVNEAGFLVVMDTDNQEDACIPLTFAGHIKQPLRESLKH